MMPFTFIFSVFTTHPNHSTAVVLNIPHSRNASDLSETIDEPESVVSFNENAYLASQNADISTVTYAEEARNNNRTASDEAGQVNPNSTKCEECGCIQSSKRNAEERSRNRW